MFPSIAWINIPTQAQALLDQEISSTTMFRVVARDFCQAFARWTDALNTAKALRPKCKSLLQDIRIFDGDTLIWVYDRLHIHPQYIGPGTYRRLAIVFLQEAMAEENPPVDHNDN